MHSKISGRLHNSTIVLSSHKAARATRALNARVYVPRVRRSDIFTIGNSCLPSHPCQTLRPEFPLKELFKFARPLLPRSSLHAPTTCRTKARSNLLCRWRTDVSPASTASGFSGGFDILMLMLMVVLPILLGQCSSCHPKVENCSSLSLRSSGGSFGGFPSGGGHK